MSGLLWMYTKQLLNDHNNGDFPSRVDFFLLGQQVKYVLRSLSACTSCDGILARLREKGVPPMPFFFLLLLQEAHSSPYPQVLLNVLY